MSNARVMNTTKKSTEPKSFRELLAMAQTISRPKAANGTVAQLEDGSVVTIEMASFVGDNGQRVRGVRISGLGGKPKFFMANVFMRLFDPATVEAAGEFMGSAQVESEEVEA